MTSPIIFTARMVLSLIVSVRCTEIQREGTALVLQIEFSSMYVDMDTSMPQDFNPYGALKVGHRLL